MSHGSLKNPFTLTESTHFSIVWVLLCLVREGFVAEGFPTAAAPMGFVSHMDSLVSAKYGLRGVDFSHTLLHLWDFFCVTSWCLMRLLKIGFSTLTAFIGRDFQCEMFDVQRVMACDWRLYHTLASIGLLSSMSLLMYKEVTLLMKPFPYSLHI